MNEYQNRYVCDVCDKISPWFRPYQDPTPEGWIVMTTSSIRVQDMTGTYLCLCDECTGPLTKALERRSAK